MRRLAINRPTRQEAEAKGAGTRISSHEAPRTNQTASKTGSRQNKSRDHGVFFGPQKASVKTPHPPRNPPQTHHQKTTSSHHFFSKPPAKTTNFLILTTAKKIRAQISAAPPRKSSRRPLPSAIH
jgi:hypothetical protein